MDQRHRNTSANMFPGSRDRYGRNDRSGKPHSSSSNVPVSDTFSAGSGASSGSGGPSRTFHGHRAAPRGPYQRNNPQQWPNKRGQVTQVQNRRNVVRPQQPMQSMQQPPLPPGPPPPQQQQIQSTQPATAQMTQSASEAAAASAAPSPAPTPVSPAPPKAKSVPLTAEESRDRELQKLREEHRVLEKKLLENWTEYNKSQLARWRDTVEAKTLDMKIQVLEAAVSSNGK